VLFEPAELMVSVPDPAFSVLPPANAWILSVPEPPVIVLAVPLV